MKCEETQTISVTDGPYTEEEQCPSEATHVVVWGEYIFKEGLAFLGLCDRHAEVYEDMESGVVAVLKADDWKEATYHLKNL
jgi:hypothetical protein